MALQEAAPSEVEGLFADIARERPDAIIVNSHGDLLAHRQLIVALAQKNRLPVLVRAYQREPMRSTPILDGQETVAFEAAQAG